MTKEERQNCRGNWWKETKSSERTREKCGTHKLDGKTYSVEMKIKVYDVIVA